MAFWPSPSRLALARECGFPWSPHGPRWPKREFLESDASRFGKAVSRVMECLGIVGGDPAIAARLAADEEQLAPAAARRLDACAHAIGAWYDEHAARITYRAAEIGLIYDLERDDAWLATPDEARRPPRGCIGGTIDVAEIEDDVLTIRDWKSGKRQADEEDASTNLQLRAYGLAAARAWQVDRVRVQLLHVSEDGIWRDPYHPHELDDLELEIVRAELIELMRSTEAGRPPAPGRHCKTRYCPIVSVCPVTAKAIAQIETDVEQASRFPMTVAIENDEHAKSVRHRLKMVEAALGPIRAELERYVTTRGAIEVEPGMLYGAREHDGTERIDLGVTGAVEIVRRHLGSRAADVAIEIDASKTSLERGAAVAAKERGDEKRGAKGRVMAPMLEELRAIGAIRRGASYVRVEEFKRRASDGAVPEDHEAA